MPDAERLIDNTGPRYLTDDELALWHSQIPNHKKASQVMQVRLMMNWCELHAGGPEKGDLATLVNVQLVRQGVLELLQTWVAVDGRGRTDIVATTTVNQGQQRKVDLSSHVPGATNPNPANAAVVVNVAPNGNGHKPTFLERLRKSRLG